MNGDNWKRFAFGVAGMAGTITLLVSTFMPDAIVGGWLWRMYFSSMMFAIGAFSALIYTSWPSVKHEMPKKLVLPTESLEKPMATNLEPAPQYAPLWLVYWRGLFGYAQDKGGIQFDRMREYFGGNRAISNTSWREVLSPFTRAKIIAPIISGQRTDFVNGWTVESLLAKLNSRHDLHPDFMRFVPDYPPPAPFEPLTMFSEGNGETPITQQKGASSVSGAERQAA